MKKIIVALGFLGIFATLQTGVSAAYFDTAPAPRCDVQIIRSLQVGSENEDVYTLQQMLSRGGYLNASPNGYFGPATRYAVERFQADNGISVTGTVGEVTRNAVNERLCDSDVRGDSSSYMYGDYSYSSYGSGTTYVDPYDPYVRVVSPVASNPTLYANPSTRVAPISNVVVPTSASNVNVPVAPYNSSYSPSYSPVTSATVGAINTFAVPSTPSAQISSTNIIYSPSVGYTYGIVPKSGSLTISSPVANTVYNEGDTVSLVWSSSNLNIGTFRVVLENTSTGQSQVVTNTLELPSAIGHITSFTLTKALLDAVCAGACDNNQTGSFRIMVTTPMTDIAGITSTFKAAVAPITIKRPFTNFGTVSITASKNPVTSGEIFKLYVNIPTGASWNSGIYGNYSFKIRATCPAGTSASIAGVPCGQDFAIPYAPAYFQSEIPAIITNTSWFQQNIRFDLTVTNLTGQVISTATANVTASAAPFSW